MSTPILMTRSKNIYHIIFWSVSLFFWLLSMYVASNFKNVLTLETISLAIAFNLCFATAVYVNLRILIPTLFKKKSFILFSLALITSVGLSALLIQFLLIYPLNSFVVKDDGFKSFIFSDWFNFFFFSFIYVGVTSIFSLTREWFILQKISSQLKDIEKENLEAELKVLKTQIKPHFLFNSLNNIYSLALDKSDKTADVVLQLSDLMRYILYDCNEKLVDINKELDFTRNYINLHKIRLDENTPVNLIINGHFDGHKIAPLLFEPFIENAFKHGLYGKNSDSFINIIFNFDENNQMELIIENSYDANWENYKKGSGGIGIQNVVRRLELIYPQKHKIDINKGEKTFKITLTIGLS
ncbi:sensor histidine kinase [Ancylomarina sp. 16SWW S1-10-2]|uniref:sensor histidine kinase n=1 Tax=Ancylomarina sp. 16SWW S1-10-2 TaxID=2499681 RepID=UPI00189E4DDF|nr:sensor histidine kinase [Ancylomarina sp. 16SWW S1-10-2]